VVRQARSEATRRKILDAAVEVFQRDGYPAGLNVILGQAQLTKGALYYHFDSERAVAAAIVSEASCALLRSFESVCQTPSPALENLIHGVFAAMDIVNTDPLVCTGGRLITALGPADDVAAIHRSWLDAVTVQAKNAVAEGDIKPELDPASVAEVILSALLGARELQPTTPRESDVARRITTVWEVLLPAIVTEESVPYFREYLSREALRHMR
jgi:AcrR family transcriptional regulator